MRFKLKNFIKNIRGSEVVEKMMMVIASVTLVAVGIGFMNKFINSAIENQIGDNSHQIEMPNGNGGSAGGQGGTVTPPIISPDESTETPQYSNININKVSKKIVSTTEQENYPGQMSNYSPGSLFTINNEIYIMGGDIGYEIEFDDRVYKYNKQTNEFEEHWKVPTNYLRADFEGIIYNNKLYALGNLNELLLIISGQQTKGRNICFDIVNKQAQDLAELPDDILMFEKTILVNDKIYCFGGITADAFYNQTLNATFDNVYVYDIQNDNYTKVCTDFSFLRESGNVFGEFYTAFNATLLNDEIYFIEASKPNQNSRIATFNTKTFKHKQVLEFDNYKTDSPNTSSYSNIIVKDEIIYNIIDMCISEKVDESGSTTQRTIKKAIAFNTKTNEIKEININDNGLGKVALLTTMNNKYYVIAFETYSGPFLCEIELK